MSLISAALDQAAEDRVTRLAARLVDAAAIVGWLVIIGGAALVDLVHPIPAESEDPRCTPWGDL